MTPATRVHLGNKKEKKKEEGKRIIRVIYVGHMYVLIAVLLSSFMTLPH